MQLLSNKGNVGPGLLGPPRPSSFSRQSAHQLSRGAGRGQRGGTLTVTVVLVVHRHVVAPGVGSTLDPFVTELSFPI